MSETPGTFFSTSPPIKHNWIHQQQMECQYSAQKDFLYTCPKQDLLLTWSHENNQRCAKRRAVVTAK
jgi:hypothetical protein